jgi:hypothetical protein
MTFREDESRIRKDNAPANMAIVRQIAMNLLKNEKSYKNISVRAKKLVAGWSGEYLIKLISNKENLNFKN